VPVPRSPEKGCGDRVPVAVHRRNARAHARGGGHIEQQHTHAAGGHIEHQLTHIHTRLRARDDAATRTGLRGQRGGGGRGGGAIAVGANPLERLTGDALGEPDDGLAVEQPRVDLTSGGEREPVDAGPDGR
jgi:hypothetical protein